MKRKYANMLNEAGFEFGRPLSFTKLDENEDGDASWRMTFRTGRKHVPYIKQDLHEALDEYCSHSYDCCGQLYRSVYTSTLKHVKRKEWSVVVVVQRNI
jgi:hypothetical protein